MSLPYRPHITINYGPYNDAGVVMHRPERILALKERLEKNGFRVLLKKWTYYDRLTISVGEIDVFDCRVTYLQYPGFPDPICERAFDAIKNESDRQLKQLADHLRKNFL